MKILQINAWQGRLIRPLLKMVRDEAADIVFTQENYLYDGRVSRDSSWNYFDTLEAMADEGGYAHRFFSPCTTYTMFGAQLGFGNAILSKFPLSETSTHYTGGPGPLHIEDTAVYDSNQTRNFQHAVAGTPEGKIHLINQHGYWVNQPLGDDQSAARTKLVSDYVSSLEGPVLVVGDFNLSPESPSIQQFVETTGFTDHVAAAGIETTLSPAHYVDRPIVCDYIFTNGKLRVSDVQSIDRLVSDHKGIIATVTV